MIKLQILMKYKLSQNYNTRKNVIPFIDRYYFLGIDLLLAGLSEHEKLMKDLASQFEKSSNPIGQSDKLLHVIGQFKKSSRVINESSNHTFSQLDKSKDSIGQCKWDLPTNQDTEPR